MLDRLKHTPSFFNSQRKRYSFSQSVENSLQNDYSHQTAREINEFIIDFLTEYLLLNCYKSFILALEYIHIQQNQKQFTLFNKFISEASHIVEVKTGQQIELNAQQNHRIDVLIASYKKKIISYLIECMRHSNLLLMVKNSKLQYISKTYEAFTLPKNHKLSFPRQKCDKIHLYYLLHGEVQKVRFFQPIKEEKKNKISQQEKNSSISPQKSHQKIENIRIYLESSIKKPKPRRNQLKTLLQSGSFIGDELFSTLIQNRPELTIFKIISEKAVMIKFEGDIVRNILAEFYYLEESKPFYEEKSIIEAQKVKSLKTFDKKYKSLCRKRQQDKLKRQLSPQMIEVKRSILKRYFTQEAHSLDCKSPKQISEMLFSKRKKLGIKSSQCELPIVQVFQNHSEKRRSNEGSILSPLAIVKTRKNYQVLNNSQNVKSKKERSQIYEVKSWQSLKSLTEDGLSKRMKKVDSIVKRRQHALGGFQLLEINRKIQKIKKEGLKI